MNGFLIYFIILLLALPLMLFTRAQTVKRYTALAKQFGGKVVPNLIIGYPLLVTQYNGRDLILTSGMVKRSGKTPGISTFMYFPQTSLPIVNDHSGWNDPWLFNSIQEWSFGLRDRRFDVMARALDWRNRYRPEFATRLAPGFDVYGNAAMLDIFLTPEVCQTITRLSTSSPIDLRFHPGGRWNGKQYELKPVPCFDVMVPSDNDNNIDAALLQAMQAMIPALEQAIAKA